ncbi:putative RNA polymerase II subunit B1 CTD phosphatase RPAP2 [Schistocerca piceifrons]|uniref:putative RNA polymerase II subunit B1 CTD phosphatase RPAP2 n=1 Tax=Schistocerca piceifrons TaxID=274613 RepID=UPI001F5F7A2D|nr:putative RNA polymerase II subunit B1 CTD phosphatase RPAP2 [Schistocerca piceifrons]
MGSIGTNITRTTGKGKSKAALRAGLPRNVRSMSKEVLEATLQKKRECNAKAQKIVESLLEKDINEEWFVGCLKFISDTHFQDVVEERAITKLCGYPLCNGILKNIPNQQYKICTTQNKVYDLTERKNFCSNHCYKAAKYLKDQLLTSPLWLRDKEEIPPFKLLSMSKSSGMVGDEVHFQQESLVDEITQLKDNNSKNLSAILTESEINAGLQNTTNEYVCVMKTEFNEILSESSKNLNLPSESNGNVSKASVNANEYARVNEIKEEDILEQSEKVTLTKNECSGVEIQSGLDYHSLGAKMESLKEKKTASEDSKDAVKKKNTNIRKKEKKESLDKHSATKVHINKQEEAPLTTLLVEKCVREWFTLDSMYFLFGEERMKEMVADKDITHYFKPTESDSWDPGMRERYIAICKKLNLLELEDINYDNKITKENKELRPLPEYSSIKEEGLKMQLKVRAFFAGKTAYEDSSVEDSSQENESSGNFIPLVDLHSKNALRRRIVLDRFNRILPDLLSTFGISSRDISDDLRSLVFSFCLSAHNITFKPTEWNLLGLIVLKMLSLRDKRIKAVLETEQSKKYMTMMLMVFQEDAGYLERLVAWLMDIDYLLQQHSGRTGS